MEGRPASEKPAAAEADAVAEDAAAPEDEDRGARPATDATEPNAKAEDSVGVDSDLDELVSARTERDEYLELAQRTKADFENYRKRMAREAAQAADRGMGKLVKELLPALDNLGLALRHAEEEDAERPSELLKGIRLVQEDLIGALGRVGVEPFSPEGEPFDPVEQEAMAQQPVESAEPGTVVEVYQQGYRLNGTVLRPARVVVAA